MLYLLSRYTAFVDVVFILYCKCIFAPDFEELKMFTIRSLVQYTDELKPHIDMSACSTAHIVEGCMYFPSELCLEPHAENSNGEPE